jgi:hypothetical protein
MRKTIRCVHVIAIASMEVLNESECMAQRVPDRADLLRLASCGDCRVSHLGEMMKQLSLWEEEKPEPIHHFIMADGGVKDYLLW